MSVSLRSSTTMKSTASMVPRASTGTKQRRSRLKSTGRPPCARCLDRKELGCNRTCQRPCQRCSLTKEPQVMDACVKDTPSNEPSPSKKVKVSHQLVKSPRSQRRAKTKIPESLASPKSYQRHLSSPANAALTITAARTDVVALAQKTTLEVSNEASQPRSSFPPSTPSLPQPSASTRSSIEPSKPATRLTLQQRSYPSAVLVAPPNADALLLTASSPVKPASSDVPEFGRGQLDDVQFTFTHPMKKSVLPHGAGNNMDIDSDEVRKRKRAQKGKGKEGGKKKSPRAGTAL